MHRPRPISTPTAPSLLLSRSLPLSTPSSRAVSGALARALLTARHLVPLGIAASRPSSKRPIPKGSGLRPLLDACHSPLPHARPAMVSQRRFGTGARASGAPTVRDPSQQRPLRQPTAHTTLRASRRVALAPPLSARARPRSHLLCPSSRETGVGAARSSGHPRPSARLPSTSRPRALPRRRAWWARRVTRCSPLREGRSTACRRGRCPRHRRCHAPPHRRSSQRCRHPRERAVSDLLPTRPGTPAAQRPHSRCWGAPVELLRRWAPLLAAHPCARSRQDVTWS